MKKRIGIIGYGWIASDVHCSNYKTVTDICEITAVCDIKPEARQKAKDKLGLSDECIFSDYRELIDSGLCDAVDICTPNNLHCPIAKYALNAGLGVSVEKPVGMSYEEVKELDELARAKGLPVFVCFSWRHKATLRFLKDLATEGSIGDLIHVYITCIKNSALWDGRRFEWRFDKKQAGTGVLCDLGSHMLDLLDWLGVPAIGLSANYGTTIKERQEIGGEAWHKVTTDDWCNIILDLEHDVSANVKLSRSCATVGGLTQVEIYGKNGKLIFNEKESDVVTRQLVGGVEEKLPVPEKYGTAETFSQCESFINLLNGKTDVYTSTLKEGLVAQRVIDAAEISGRERRYVKLDEIK